MRSRPDLSIVRRNRTASQAGSVDRGRDAVASTLGGIEMWISCGTISSIDSIGSDSICISIPIESNRTTIRLFFSTKELDLRSNPFDRRPLKVGDSIYWTGNRAMIFRCMFRLEKIEVVSDGTGNSSTLLFSQNTQTPHHPNKNFGDEKFYVPGSGKSGNG